MKFNLLAYDKALHALAGLLCVLFFQLLTWVISRDFHSGLAGGGVVGLVICVLIAYAKESYDQDRPERHTADGWDAFVTIVGGSCWLTSSILGYYIAKAL